MASFKKDLLSVLKSKVTILLCGLVTNIITARYLGPEGSGQLSLLIVIPELMVVLGSMGVRQSSAYMIGKNQYSKEKIFSNVMALWLLTSIFCMVSCYIFLKYLAQINFTNTTILLSIVSIPFSLLGTYSAGLFLGENRISEFNSVSWIPEVTRVVAFVVFIIFLPLGVDGALLGRALGYMLMMLVVWGYVRKTISVGISLDFGIFKGLVTLGGVYALSLVIVTLNYKVDVILLERWADAYQVGIYTKGVSLIEKLWQIPAVFGAIIFARSAVAKNSRKFSYTVTQILRLCLLAMAAASLALYLLSDFIVVLFFGEEFLPSSDVQRILIIGVLFMTVFKVLNMDVAGRGKPWLAMIAMAPALILNIYLNYLWIEEFGANGAAWASTISYSVGAITFLLLYSYEVKISIVNILKVRREDFDSVLALVKKGGK